MKFLNRYLKGARSIVFFDLEGTQTTQEIIAIGAIKTDLDNKYQIKKIYKPFKVYVKSIGKVGKIIEELTSITDELLDKEGVVFKDAFNSFENYVGKNISQVKFLSYGSFDIRLLKNSATLNNLANHEFFSKILANYIDFSLILKNYVKNDNNEILSLLDALKVFNITPQGEAHDPSSDAYNLMQLYKAFLKEKGIVKEQYLKSIINNQKLPRAVQKVLKDLEQNKTVDLETLKKYIEEEI